MSLSLIVELYRTCGRPSFHNGDFACTGEYALIKGIIKKIKEQIENGAQARFTHMLVDNVDVLDDGLPDQGHLIDFQLRLPTNSASTFHLNLTELLVKDPLISHGQIPENFYLVEEDYYSGDNLPKPATLEALDSLCRLIRSLSLLAHYHDKKPNGDYLRLVFVQPAEESGGRAVVLESKVTIALLEAAKVNPSLVEMLSESSATNDPHYSAKVGVFGTSLATFVSTRPTSMSAFEYLVLHWQQFVESYQRDLSTYLSGFAFHKAKREVAEAELKIADEFSKVLSDITGKLLSVPVSIAAVAAMYKDGSLLQRLLLLIGILTASVVVSRLVANQKQQVDRIKHAKDLVLHAVEGKKDVYPEELAVAITEMATNLDKNEQSLGRTLRLFSFLSWLPFIAAILLLSYMYFSEINRLILVLGSSSFCVDLIF